MIPARIFVISLALCLVACLLTGILKTPTITQQDFHYSATYWLHGEVKTLEGIYRCRFNPTPSGTDPLTRYYEGECDWDSHVLAKENGLELHVIFSFDSAYLMGEEYSDAPWEPYLAVFDGEGYEYSDPESLAKFDAELISFEMPEPIENTFVFSGFSILHGGSMLAMLAVGLLVIAACLIFVKRDEGVTYRILDKVSIGANFFAALAVLPLHTLVIGFMPLYVSGDELYYQLALCIPALSAFAVAASICLRRKGFTKAGFFVQLAGILMFSLVEIWEMIM